jgi:hypothetical protein
MTPQLWVFLDPSIDFRERDEAPFRPVNGSMDTVSDPTNPQHD